MTLSQAARRSAQTMLSAQVGSPVRLAGVEDFPYSRVARCTLQGDGRALPRTVIVRLLRDEPARSHPGRMHNEQAALELLGSIGSSLAPRFIAGDASAGLVITEDLGPHPSLLDLLLGDDREAAYEGVLAFARSLGRLHAQTAGRASVYAHRRAQLGPADPYAEHPGVRPPVAETWRQVRDAVEQLGLPDPRGVEDDVDAIGRLLTAPGPFLALSSGDPSPVNCKVVDGTVRFFDFEGAGFRHALIDAAVLRYPYPTGGPVWRLPSELADAAERAYRHELARACPAALADAVFE
ncbi:MAG: hypothetical protein JOZ41_22265, partial [Chloroflexi bacterium]|nr:hypothetical protein [Chloroflexota bacterium]